MPSLLTQNPPKNKKRKTRNGFGVGGLPFGLFETIRASFDKVRAN